MAILVFSQFFSDNLLDKIFSCISICSQMWSPLHKWGPPKVRHLQPVYLSIQIILFRVLVQVWLHLVTNPPCAISPFAKSTPFPISHFLTYNVIQKPNWIQNLFKAEFFFFDLNHLGLRPLKIFRIRETLTLLTCADNGISMKNWNKP